MDIFTLFHLDFVGHSSQYTRHSITYLIAISRMEKCHFHFSFIFNSIVAPEIDKTILRAASGENERGRLPCRAQAAPMPKFLWTFKGQNLNVNKTWKYNVELKQIDALTFESILLIEKVGKTDYGDYECMARNELGSSKEIVKLEVTSKPDTPLSLNILNTTHDSVTLAWTPGFDGGMKASYRVRYREMNSEHYKYEDGLPNSHKLTITGLKMNTVYLFSVMASNQLGNSNYLPDLTRAQTKGKKKAFFFFLISLHLHSHSQ